MTRLIAPAFCFLVCASPILANESENLVPNGGFESDADGDGMPDGWRFDWKYTHSNDRELGLQKQKPRVTWDDAVVHSGDRSLFVANERPEDDGVWTLADVPVGGGAEYFRLQVWMKTEKMNGTEALVSGVFLGENGKWLGANYNAVAVNADRDWTQYTGYLQSTEA